jgi:serine acetyltransferase
VVGAPRQASLRRLDQFDIRPRRDLGQNFLIDSNILGVIERAAELGPADVVLEVGGGLGVLSEHLAARAPTPPSTSPTPWRSTSPRSTRRRQR